jgi:hypothetical protein
MITCRKAFYKRKINTKLNQQNSSPSPSGHTKNKKNRNKNICDELPNKKNKKVKRGDGEYIMFIDRFSLAYLKNIKVALLKHYAALAPRPVRLFSLFLSTRPVYLMICLFCADGLDFNELHSRVDYDRKYKLTETDDVATMATMNVDHQKKRDRARSTFMIHW